MDLINGSDMTYKQIKIGAYRDRYWIHSNVNVTNLIMGLISKLDPFEMNASDITIGVICKWI